MARMKLLNLLSSGKSLAEPEEDEAPVANNGGGQGATLSATQIQAAADADMKDALAENNKRWNAVMTSDVGAANPKAAARLLMSGNGSMSADDVMATLGDIAPPPAATTTTNDQQASGDAGTGGGDLAPTSQSDRQAQHRERLANDANTRPKTGAAAGSQQQNRGEGDDGAASAREARRNKRAAARNPAGGKQANKQN